LTDEALTHWCGEPVAAWRALWQVPTFEAYTAATTIYVMVTLVVVFGMRWVEKKVAVPGLISAGGAPMAGH